MKCYMDQTVDPCDRFFDYACGRWSHHHPIPNDKGGYDTFEILREDLSANLIQMFREPELETDGNATTAVKRLYASCMDVGKTHLLHQVSQLAVGETTLVGCEVQAVQHKVYFTVQELHFGSRAL